MEPGYIFSVVLNVGLLAVCWGSVKLVNRYYKEMCEWRVKYYELKDEAERKP